VLVHALDDGNQLFEHVAVDYQYDPLIKKNILEFLSV